MQLIKSSVWKPSVFLNALVVPAGVDNIYCKLPEYLSISQDEVQFFGCGVPLNEFGYFYVALYILRMLSRFYPDLCHREIDNATDLSIAAEFLLDAAIERMPLLALGELESKYFLLR